MCLAKSPFWLFNTIIIKILHCSIHVHVYLHNSTTLVHLFTHHFSNVEIDFGAVIHFHAVSVKFATPTG